MEAAYKNIKESKPKPVQLAFKNDSSEKENKADKRNSIKYRRSRTPLVATWEDEMDIEE